MKKISLLLALLAVTFWACESNTATETKSTETEPAKTEEINTDVPDLSHIERPEPDYIANPANEQEAAEVALWKETMKIHDEVMPYTGQVNRIKRAIKGKIGEAGQGGGLKLNSSTKKMLTTLQDLDKAEKDMFDWMKGLQQLPDLRKTKSHEEIMAYLEAEKLNIRRVGINTSAVIITGKELLDAMKPEGNQ